MYIKIKQITSNHRHRPSLLAAAWHKNMHTCVRACLNTHVQQRRQCLTEKQTTLKIEQKISIHIVDGCVAILAISVLHLAHCLVKMY